MTVDPGEMGKGELTSGPEGDVKAFLGQGTEFQGTLTFEGTVRVDGKLYGEVVSGGTLIVGEEAEVEAEINVGSLISRGRIKGNVKLTDRIELYETSELRGNITTPRLIISEGAVFQGSCDMHLGEEEATPLDEEEVPLIRSFLSPLARDKE